MTSNPDTHNALHTMIAGLILMLIAILIQIAWIFWLAIIIIVTGFVWLRHGFMTAIFIFTMLVTVIVGGFIGGMIKL